MARASSIGEILVERGTVTRERLDEASRRARLLGRRICSQLLESGSCSEGDLVAALAEQHGVPGIDLSASVLDLSALAALTHSQAIRDGVLPLSTEGGRLHVAILTPNGTEKALAALRAARGLEVVPYVAVASSLADTIAAAFGARERGQEELRGPHAPVADGIRALAVHLPAVSAEDVVGIEDVEILPEGNAPAPHRVLVVDDDEAIRTLAARTLAARGLAVQTAADGESALEAALRDPPDLVLLDAMLPRVHGFEVARRLRGDPRTAQVIIVVMSAVHRGWRYAEDARAQFGVADYLEKPFRIDELQKRVDAALAAVPRRARGAPADPENADPASAGAAERLAMLLERGRALYTAGDRAAATAVFEEAVNADGTSAEAHFRLGKSLLAFDPFRAMGVLERAADLRPAHFATHRALATVYLEHGFSSKGVEALERAHLAARDPALREALRRELLRLG